VGRVRHGGELTAVAGAVPADQSRRAAQRLLLLLDIDRGADFTGRVEVVGAPGGGDFSGWIDFMAVVDSVCAAYGTEAPSGCGS